MNLLQTSISKYVGCLVGYFACHGLDPGRAWSVSCGFDADRPQRLGSAGTLCTPTQYDIFHVTIYIHICAGLYMPIACTPRGSIQRGRSRRVASLSNLTRSLRDSLLKAQTHTAMNTLELNMVKNEHESIQLVIWNPPWSPATARDISWSVSGLDLDASVTPVGYVVGG